MRTPLFIIILTVFVDLLGFGIIIPLVALYGSHYGASAGQLAILGCIYSLMQFIFSPLWGTLSDRYGRRPILLISLFGSTTSYIVFSFAPNYEWLLISRAFAGLFAANISTAHAYIADITTEDERAKGMGLLGAAIGLGFTIGPPVGGISAKQIGLFAPGLIAAAICGVNFVLAIFFLPESRKVDESTVEKRSFERISSPLDLIANLRQLAKHPVLWTLLLVFFVNTFAFSHMEQAFSLFVQATRSLSTEDASYESGMLLLWIGVVGILIQGACIKPLVQRYGESNLLTSGIAISAIGMAVFAASQTFAQLLLAGMVIAVGSSLLNPTLSSLISKKSKEESQGTVFGITQGLGSLARTFGPFTGLYAFSLFQPLPFIIAAILYAFLFVFGLNVQKRVPIACPARQ